MTNELIGAINSLNTLLTMRGLDPVKKMVVSEDTYRDLCYVEDRKRIFLDYSWDRGEKVLTVCGVEVTYE